MSQLEFKINLHGGARSGAGRKPIRDEGIRHRARPIIKLAEPMHVTLRLVAGLPSLRSRNGFALFAEAAKRASKFGLKIIQYSIQTNHLHLLIESSDKKILERGMKSFTIKLAKGINRENRKGRVVATRFHLRVLKKPRQVRSALIYVFANFAKHTGSRRIYDWFSSFPVFKHTEELKRSDKDRDWTQKEITADQEAKILEIISPPESWLARVGWQRVRQGK